MKKFMLASFLLLMTSISSFASVFQLTPDTSKLHTYYEQTKVYTDFLTPCEWETLKLRNANSNLNEARANKDTVDQELAELEAEAEEKLNKFFEAQEELENAENSETTTPVHLNQLEDRLEQARQEYIEANEALEDFRDEEWLGANLLLSQAQSRFNSQENLTIRTCNPVSSR